MSKPAWLALSEKHGAKVREQNARSTQALVDESARTRPGRSVYGDSGPLSKPEPYGQAKPMERWKPVTEKVALKKDAGRGAVSPLGNKVW
jgi:hypothetical protein